MNNGNNSEETNGRPEFSHRYYKLPYIILVALALSALVYFLAIEYDKCPSPQSDMCMEDRSICIEEAQLLRARCDDALDIHAFVDSIFSFIEGSFGALGMVVSFALSLFFFLVPFKRIKTTRRIIIALSFLILAAGFFWLRSVVTLFMKPVIYIYSPTTQTVDVQLRYKGEILVSYPEYNTTKKGWSVTADANGKLTNAADQKEYSYLFWEGKPDTQIDFKFDKGFVVKGEDTQAFLQNTLAQIGLTPREYNEFIVYWYPRMKANKYNLVYFAGQEYIDSAPLAVSPKPDSLLRVFMVFKAIDKPIAIAPQEFEPVRRDGLTVVEWGGTELKTSGNSLFE